MPRDALLAVRGLTDTGAGLRPNVPGGWDWEIAANGWVTLWPLGRDARPDVFAHACLVVRDSGDPTRGLWVLVGPRAMLDQIESAGSVRTWRSLPLLRADNGAVATAIKAQWPSSEGGAAVQFRRRIAGFFDDDAETAT